MFGLAILIEVSPRLKQLARILTSFYSRRLILNITLFGKAIFLERVIEQKSLEVNNEDDNFEKGNQNSQQTKEDFTGLTIIASLWEDNLHRHSIEAHYHGAHHCRINVPIGGSSHLSRRYFIAEYSKLFAMIENLLEGIFHDTKVKEVLSVISSERKDQVIVVIKIFQTPFLALCLGLPSGNVPSKGHIARIISRIQEENEAIQLDGHLILRILREMGKALLLLTRKKLNTKHPLALKCAK
ncbi:hypothetical protein AAG906_006740 [Vitis piasezkii]